MPTIDEQIKQLKEQAERRARALELREAGRKWSEIALLLGVSSQRAEQLAKKAKAERDAKK